MKFISYNKYLNIIHLYLIDTDDSKIHNNKTMLVFIETGK